MTLQIEWKYERDVNGLLTGFISIITDITYRKKAEDFLQRRTRGLATLLDTSKQLVASLDLQEILQAMVDSATQLVGLDTSAVYLLEGNLLHLWATTPPLPLEFPYELRVALLDDHPHLRKSISSGEPLWVPDIMTVELTPAERSVVEQRNLRSVLYLPLMADDAAEGALIAGSVGHVTTVTSAETDLCRTLANFAALAVKNARLYMDRNEYAEKLEQTLAEQKRSESERQNLERQLAQARKLESIGRLAGGVAHDFNNMLTVILGQAELAQMRLDPSDPLYGDLEEIRSAGKRSATLTQRLLAFARKQATHPGVLDLNEIIDGMVKMLRRLIGESVSSVRPKQNSGRSGGTRGRSNRSSSIFP